MNPVTKARRTLQALKYDFKNYKLETFVSHLEAIRGCKIKLYYLDMPPGVTGAWLTNADQPQEYIFIAQNIAPFLQQRALFHELGHMLMGHRFEPISHAQLADWRRIKWRRIHQDRDLDEAEAEAFAAQVQKALYRHARFSAMGDIKHFSESLGVDP